MLTVDLAQGFGRASASAVPILFFDPPWRIRFLRGATHAIAAIGEGWIGPIQIGVWQQFKYERARDGGGVWGREYHG